LRFGKGVCVNHKILLTKLKFYGITGNDYKLYKSYLTDIREQYCIMKTDIL